MSEFKAGDMLAVSSKSFTSGLIQMGSLSLPNIGPLGKWGWSGASHVIILAPVWGELLAYESTSFPRPPCIRTGRENPTGVQAHRIADIFDGHGDVWHYPLRRPLYPHEEERLIAAVDACLGRSYDFLGAGKSAGGLLSRLANRLKGNEDMREIFCSELVLWTWIQTGIAQNKHAGGNPTWLCRYALAKGICSTPQRVTLDSFTEMPVAA